MCMYQWLLDLKNSITTIHTTGHSYATKSILRVKQWATLVPVLYKVRIPDHWYKNWSTHASVSMDAYVLAASTKVLWRENQIGLRMSLKWRWTKCLQEVQWVLSCTILTLRVPDHCYIKIFGCLLYWICPSPEPQLHPECSWNEMKKWNQQNYYIWVCWICFPYKVNHCRSLDMI